MSGTELAMLVGMLVVAAAVVSVLAATMRLRPSGLQGRLDQLATLRAEGALTESEYQDARSRVLSEDDEGLLRTS